MAKRDPKHGREQGEDREEQKGGFGGKRGGPDDPGNRVPLPGSQPGQGGKKAREDDAETTE